MYLVTFPNSSGQFFAKSLDPIVKYLHQWYETAHGGEDCKIIIEPSSQHQMTDDFFVDGELVATAQFLSSIERLL